MFIKFTSTNNKPVYINPACVCSFEGVVYNESYANNTNNGKTIFQMSNGHKPIVQEDIVAVEKAFKEAGPMQMELVGEDLNAKVVLNDKTVNIYFNDDAPISIEASPDKVAAIASAITE